MFILAIMRKGGAVATPEDGRLPAGVRATALHLGAETVCVLACVRGCGVRKPRYSAFRDYSSRFVCVESGQRGRPKSYMTPPVLLGA